MYTSPMNGSSASTKGKAKAKAVSKPITMVGSPVDRSSSTVATSVAALVVGSPSSGTLTLIALSEITGTEGRSAGDGEAIAIMAGDATGATSALTLRLPTLSTSSSSSYSAGELKAESDATLLLGSLSSTASTAATTVASVSISSLKGIEIEIAAGADVELHMEEEGDGTWEEKIADAMDTSVLGSLLEASLFISSSPSTSYMLSPSLSSSSVSTHSTSSSSCSIPIVGTPLDISISSVVKHIFALYSRICRGVEVRGGFHV